MAKNIALLAAALGPEVNNLQGIKWTSEGELNEAAMKLVRELVGMPPLFQQVVAEVIHEVYTRAENERTERIAKEGLMEMLVEKYEAKVGRKEEKKLHF